MFNPGRNSPLPYSVSGITFARQRAWMVVSVDPKMRASHHMTVCTP